MPMRPLSCTDEGCRNSQIANRSMITGSAKATLPNRPAERVGVERDRNRVGGVEPLHDRARDGEQEDEERNAVPALVLREGLLAEHTRGAADRVREPQPRGGEEARTLDRLLLRGRELARRALAGGPSWMSRSSATTDAPGYCVCARGRPGARSHAFKGNAGQCSNRGCRRCVSALPWVHERGEQAFPPAQGVRREPSCDHVRAALRPRLRLRVHASDRADVAPRTAPWGCSRAS